MSQCRSVLNEIPLYMGNQNVVITGATSGVGLAFAQEIARRKARIVIAGRNKNKMAAVAAQLLELGASDVEQLYCNLSDLERIRECVQEYSGLPIDVLLLNAGLMKSNFHPTSMGYETTFTTNYLGHFLLTGLMLPHIRGRVVAVSSGAHHNAEGISWEIVSGRKPEGFPPGSILKGSEVYAESKLAILLFVEELNRRLVALRSNIIAVGAHPGISNTPFQMNVVWSVPRIIQLALCKILHLIASTPEKGALPLLMAAFDVSAQRGSYYGPKHWLLPCEINGPPTRHAMKSRKVSDQALAKSLWIESEKMTDFEYGI